MPMLTCDTEGIGLSHTYSTPVSPKHIYFAKSILFYLIQLISVYIHIFVLYTGIGMCLYVCVHVQNTALVF